MQLWRNGDSAAAPQPSWPPWPSSAPAAVGKSPCSQTHPAPSRPGLDPPLSGRPRPGPIRTGRGDEEAGRGGPCLGLPAADGAAGRSRSAEGDSLGRGGRAGQLGESGLCPGRTGRSGARGPLAALLASRLPGRRGDRGRAAPPRCSSAGTSVAKAGEDLAGVASEAGAGGLGSFRPLLLGRWKAERSRRSFPPSFGVGLRGEGASRLHAGLRNSPAGIKIAPLVVDLSDRLPLSGEVPIRQLACSFFLAGAQLASSVRRARWLRPRPAS